MEKIIQKIAREQNLDEDVIEKAVRAQFKFVVEAMQQGEYDSVHLHFLGKFAVKPGTLKRINDKQRI